MKRFIPFLIALTVAGCSGMASMPAVQGISNEVLRAQQLARQFCGFLPTVESIGLLFSVANPALMTADGIANQICAVVSHTTFAGPRNSSVVIKVKGYTVRGRLAP